MLGQKGYRTTSITTALRLVPPEDAVTVMLNVPGGVLPGGPCEDPLLPPPQETISMVTVSKPSIARLRTRRRGFLPARANPNTESPAHHHPPGWFCSEANVPVVLSVRMMLCVPPAPEKLKLPGDAAQLAPAGSPLHENDPDPVNPGAADRTSEAVELPPPRTETWLELGSTLRLKSVTPVPVS